MVLIVSVGSFISSSKYNNRRDGSARKIKIREGSTVHIISICCPSMIKREENELVKIEIRE